MLQGQNRHHGFRVDLIDGIVTHTSIAPSNHGALRSGFAGCPVNPRWSGVKYHAWKVGRQLRQDLTNGDLVVRATDSLLVETMPTEDIPTPPPASPHLWDQLRQQMGGMFSTV